MAVKKRAIDDTSSSSGDLDISLVDFAFASLRLGYFNTAHGLDVPIIAERFDRVDTLRDTLRMAQVSGRILSEEYFKLDAYEY